MSHLFGYVVNNKHGDCKSSKDRVVGTPSIHGRTSWLINGGYYSNYLKPN